MADHARDLEFLDYVDGKGPCPYTGDDPSQKYDPLYELIAKKIRKAMSTTKVYIVVDRNYVMVDMVNISVMGTKFENSAGESRQELLKELKLDDIIELRREPTNAHDENAVGIYFRGKNVGYAPRALARLIAKDMDAYGKPVFGAVTNIIKDDYERITFNFKVLQPIEEI